MTMGLVDVRLVICFPSNLECCDPKEGRASRKPMDPGCCPRKVGCFPSCYDSKSPFYYTHPVTSICYVTLKSMELDLQHQGICGPKSNHKNPSFSDLTCWVLNAVSPKSTIFLCFFCMLNFCRRSCHTSSCITSQITILRSIFFSL